MTKGLITIFAQPQEIDDLHITLYNLKRNMSILSDDITFDLDLTLCLSDELTDWENSVLPKQYFIDKLNAMWPLWDWSNEPRIAIEMGSEILGCVSQRRKSLELLNDYDFTVWLDCDLFFKDDTFQMLAAGYNALYDRGLTHFVITPEFVKQWDTGWDVIVNKRFLNHKIDYELEADIFVDTLVTDDVPTSLKKLNTFKFAGGWCTLISNELLKLIGIPESFGHYGMEDTFIVEVCKMMSGRIGGSPEQWILENHIVGENYVHRCNKHMRKNVISKNRKEEFRAIATSNFTKEIKLLMDKIYAK